jgi:disulfide bond formation protein DsbB
MGVMSRLDDAAVWAVLLALSSAAILIALGFEHIGGYEPCPLCYIQRWPYYALIALAAAALAMLHQVRMATDAHFRGFDAKTASQEELARRSASAPGGLSAFLFGRIGLLVAMLILVASAVLGAHHAGVEWGWWPGPATCAGGVGDAAGGGSLLDRMQASRVVRCDEAQGRFLGLSFAGYNALLSLALAGFVAAYLYRMSRSSHVYVAFPPDTAQKDH